MWTVAHISDLHLQNYRGARPWGFFNKRLVGSVNLLFRRGRQHSNNTLLRLLEDVDRVAPDHLIVSGDLSNLSLEGEFNAGRSYLEQFALPASEISVVPGNHDCYIAATARRGTFDNVFAPFIAGEQAGPDPFPFLRIRGDGLAIIGLSSARPSPPMMAVGTLGDDQLARAEALLSDPRLEGRFRIVVLHHPPQSAHIHWHNRLTDGEKLLQMLKRAGAELVLHGHLHRTCVESIPGPEGSIPVAGVCSASWVGAPDPARTARYHLYEKGPDGGVELSIRRYDKETDTFVVEKTLPLG